MSWFRPTRLLTIALTVALTVVGVTAAGGLPDRAASWLSPRPEGSGRQGLTDAELDRVLQSLHQSEEAKAQIIADVIAESRSLRHAAILFECGDVEVSPWARARLDLYPGSSDDERQCQRVIAFVRSQMQDEPSRCQVIVSRLEAELQALNQGGAVSLTHVSSQNAPTGDS